MGIITTVYYTMENGKVVQEDVMEEDYNSAPTGGDPQTRSLTDDAELYSMLQTEIPVTLQMFTPDEIRSIGWKELISRYPFVAADSSESAAYAALPQVQTVFPDAYVKYSGDYIGG